MSVPETPKASEAEDMSQTLKLELKQWEKAFAIAHGRKAGRNDIKENPDIAAKYKQYNNLRSALANAAATGETKKRAAPTSQHLISGQTSPKRRKLSQPLHPASVDPYDSPRSVYRTPTLHRVCIGPTPQKEGRVLGLFDLLSPELRNANTPSKRSSLGVVNLNALAMPSKPVSSPNLKTSRESQAGSKLSKPPMSPSTSMHREPFVTPSIRRIAEQQTPRSRSGVSKLRFDVTPAFLRRDSQQACVESQDYGIDGIDENADTSWSPVAVRQRAKPLGRGLSTLVKGLRALEDERLDEEMDLMREIEQNGTGEGGTLQSCIRKPTVAVGDSQVADMPLGPDRFGNSEDELEDTQAGWKGRDSKPHKAWKKKGQKRTTRKSNMKPTTQKWKPEPQWKGPENPFGENEPALVAETQFLEQVAPQELDESLEAENDMEYLPASIIDAGNDVDGGGKATERRDKKNECRTPDKVIIQTAPKKKKISSTAHANFRALKIKNKQSKAKGGSRFGRRQR